MVTRKRGNVSPCAEIVINELTIALGALGLVAVVAIVVMLFRREPSPTGPAGDKAPGPPRGIAEKVFPPDDSVPLSADQMVLLTLPGSQPFRIEKSKYRIGRLARDSSVPPPDLNLEPFTGKYGSRKHAIIYRDPGTQQWCIKDEGSMNGTFINERQLPPGEVHILRHRDRISFTDRFEVVFEDVRSRDSVPSVAGYEVMELVAKGGMAAVYMGRKGSELVAIKVPVDYGEDSRLSELRLKDEFDITQRLNSRRAAKGIEFTRCSDGRPAMVMEFLHGQTLRSYLQKSSISTADVIPVAFAVAEGLQALHDLDRIHCDLKPDNVMMRQQASTPQDIANHAVLIDFGIAMQNRTMMRNVFGSANYQSPEHILGQQLTLKSDVYSLGCMMYEMAANSRLYPDAEKVKDIKEFQVNRMPLDVVEQAAKQGRSIPPELGKLIMLMLEKSANVRPDLRTVIDRLNGLRSRASTTGF